MTANDITKYTNQVFPDDCMDILPLLPDDSVHACVCDPPYGLGFMGKSWDQFDPHEYQSWCKQWATDVYDALRPGGHLLAFSGNRTHHRLFSGIEDAGFTIRDTITWHYASGMPKGRDVPKAIDDELDVDRTQVGTEEITTGMQNGSLHAGRESTTTQRPKTVATSDEAKQWTGWHTSLKPATEFVVVARKPFPDNNVAQNVIEYGTGALNIGDTAIQTVVRDDPEQYTRNTAKNQHTYADGDESAGDTVQTSADPDGRWTPNVAFDEIVATWLDADVGDTSAGGNTGAVYSRDESTVYSNTINGGMTEYDDTGGPSRYFYTSKASRSERTLNGMIDNPHPTVKPLDLMEWLVQLVTAEDQIVLDPFAGTGTTLRAAKKHNRRFIGIEQDQQWADVARVRVGIEPSNPTHVRPDDLQQGLEHFGTGDTGGMDE